MRTYSLPSLVLLTTLYCGCSVELTDVERRSVSLGSDASASDGISALDLFDPDSSSCPPQCLDDITLAFCIDGQNVEQPCAFKCDVNTDRCAAPSIANLTDLSPLCSTSQDLNVTFATILDTDAGTVGDNTVQSRTEVSQGAGLPTLTVMSFRSMNIEEGETLRVTGSKALVLLICQDATLSGVLELNAASSRGGPGGYSGGADRQPGQGLGAGRAGGANDVAPWDHTGGGGGGYGGFGGAATATPNVPEALGGVSVLNPALSPLYGGGGGGAGGEVLSATGASGGGDGGGGGGALQLVVGGTLTVDTLGGINVGGAGGKASRDNSSGGGGGGAGGAILIQAGAVNILGALAANGGGGGGSAYRALQPTDGENGQLGRSPAQGGLSVGDQTVGNGGAGGALETQPDGLPSQTSEYATGGGGGSVGQIRIDVARLFSNNGTISPTPVVDTAWH